MPTPRATSQPTTQIFKLIFRQVQFATAIDFAELRMRSEVGMRGVPRFPPRSPPCKFLSGFSASAFCKLQLILRRCLSSQGVAWQALHRTLTFSSGRIAAHHAPFSTSAFCKVQLILRRCGCGINGGAGANAARSSAWLALRLRLTFSKLSVFKK